MNVLNRKGNTKAKLAWIMAFLMAILVILPPAAEASAAAKPTLEKKYKYSYVGTSNTYKILNLTKGYTLKWKISGKGSRYASFSNTKRKNSVTIKPSDPSSSLKVYTLNTPPGKIGLKYKVGLTVYNAKGKKVTYCSDIVTIALQPTTPTVVPTLTPTITPTLTPTPTPTVTPVPYQPYNPVTVPTQAPSPTPTLTPTPVPSIPITPVPTVTPTTGSSITLSVNKSELSTFPGTALVYFYAEVNGNVASVNLLDSASNVIAVMKDDGLYSVSGDDLQNDGIFSCKLNIDVTQAIDFDYKAEADQDAAMVSNTVQIHVIDELTDAQLADIQMIDTLIASLRDNAVYKAADTNGRKILAEVLLNSLAESGKILNDSITYDEVAGIYTFTYSCGILGGIMIKDFGDSYNDAEARDSSADNSFDLMSLAQAPSADEKPVKIGNAVILNAFDKSSFRQDFYINLQQEWNKKGLETSLDTDVTVNDIKSLSNYEVIMFSGHGVYFTHKFGPQMQESKTDPVWCLNETATTTSDKAYSKDLKQHRIAKVNGTYFVFPSLISSSYGTSALSKSFVCSESCEFMGKDADIVTSFPDALTGCSAKAVVGYHNSVFAEYSRNFIKAYIDNLIDGLTSQKAFDKAITDIGANDGDTPPAYPILKGDGNATLVNNTIKNGSFELASSPTYWNTAGDVRVIAKLGSAVPQEGSKMAILTTGIGSAEAGYLSGTEGSVLSQSFTVSGDNPTLTFDYNVISEEPMEYVGSKFDDKFVATILDKDGNVLKQLAYESINQSSWNTMTGVDFEGGDHTVYQTYWKNVSVDLSGFSNQVITLRFVVYDVGDSAFDTAAVIDHVAVTQNNQP